VRWGGRIGGFNDEEARKRGRGKGKNGCISGVWVSDCIVSFTGI